MRFKEPLKNLKKYMNSPAGFILKSSTLICSFFLFFSPFAYCNGTDDLVELFDTGGINWSKGIVEARGTSEPFSKMPSNEKIENESIKLAKQDALNNLFETVKEVRIDSESKVGQLIMKNSLLHSKVEEMIGAAQIVKQKYLSDGTVEIVLQMSLYGGFTQLFLPSGIRQIEPVKQIGSKSSFSANVPSEAVFTGLLVDARGIKINPAMVIRIMDETGEKVYGPAFASREFAVQHGMCGYVHDAFDYDLKAPRIAHNPLTVKALNVGSRKYSDIVISNADAAKIRKISNNLAFLKKCRVILLVDGFEEEWN